MKFFVGFLAIVFVYGNCVAQSLSRENKGRKYTVSPVQASVGKPDGWQYSETEGKWSKQSVIFLSKEYGYLNNLRNISVYKTNRDGTPYTVLTLTYEDGYYKYPNIKQGFTMVTMTKAYVLENTSDVSKMVDALNQTDTNTQSEFTPGVIKVDLPYVANNVITEDDVEESVNRMFTKWELYSSKFSNGTVTIMLFPAKVKLDKEARFLIQTSSLTPTMDLTEKSFDQAYFVVPLADFVKLAHALQ